MKIHRRVLVTGSAGRIGGAVAAALVQHGWHVRGLDRSPSPNASESIVANLTDAPAVANATQGVEALIHLAATPDDADFMAELLPNNVVGLYNVLEAAREAQVPRVLLASTGQLNWWQQQDGPWPIRADDPLTPRHWYAVTKVAAEAAGKAFAHQSRMVVLAVRLGWCPRTTDQVQEIARSRIGQNTYLSPGDAGRFFVRALEVPLDPQFAVVFVTSRPVHEVLFDLEPAKRLLGWEPTDQWPNGVEWSGISFALHRDATSILAWANVH